MEKEDILSVKITISKYEVLLSRISECIYRKNNFYIVTPNPEMVIIAQKDDEFRAILNNSEYSIPDGSGLLLASKLNNGKIEDRITGTDLMVRLCELAEESKWQIFLLGAKDGIAELAKEKIEEKYGKIVLGTFSGSWNEKDDKITRAKILKIIGNQHIDILFVAFGAPLQEKWIYRNIPLLPVSLSMGVGGAFDYISGSVKRAPLFMRRMGLEWLFRLINQPWRWKRQLRLIEFLFLVIKQKFINSK